MSDLEYYLWCKSYISNIPLYANWYNRDEVVSEEISPTTLEGLFGNVMNLLFNLNECLWVQ